MIENLLFLLTVISFIIPTTIFGLYGSILLYYYNKTQKGFDNSNPRKTNSFEPNVTIVIPTHNEESIIAKKIENLLTLKYPREKLEIIFVDDSEDSTPDIIAEYSKRSPQILLMSFDERVGYSPCMIAGCRAAKGEIVVLSDAGSFMDSQAIVNLVRHFNNPKIGAVTGKDVILNVDEEVGRSEELYQKLYNFIRTAETNIDSTFYFKGEASAVRKDLMADFERCDATFDTATALFVREKGYKAIFDPNVKFYEYAPKTHTGRVKQKTIRAANLIRILFQFKGMVLNPRYGKFGTIILPMNLAMLVIAPVAILMGIALLMVYTFFNLTLSTIIWSALAILLLSFMAISRRLLLTLFEFEYSVIKALYDTFFAKRTHDKIDRVDSTRR